MLMTSLYVMSMLLAYDNKRGITSCISSDNNPDNSTRWEFSIY